MLSGMTIGGKKDEYTQPREVVRLIGKLFENDAGVLEDDQVDDVWVTERGID